MYIKNMRMRNSTKAHHFKERRGMLKETRKVTSRNRAHRWRISSLRPRRAPRSLFLALPCTPAHSRPPKTQSYVWLHVSLKNSSRVRKMSIVMIFESKKWTSAAGARGEGGEKGREWERARSPVLAWTLFRSRFLPSLHPPRSTNTWCSRVWGQYEPCRRVHEYAPVLVCVVRAYAK